MTHHNNLIESLYSEISSELFSNILPYWMNHTIDDEYGGFVGRIDGRGNLVPKSEKGVVLNARILWTFASAYRLYGKPEYLSVAERAKDYILNHFLDKENGGVYWSVDYRGHALVDKKQIYAIAFVIYGLSEYARSIDDPRVIEVAGELFEVIEKYAWESSFGGYLEAKSRAWNNLDDLRLSEKDMNVCKTMNTHLHVLEAYTNLYRVCPDERLEERIRTLIHIFSDKFLGEGGSHLHLFFDNEWNNCNQVVSFGHDIEFTWLIMEAAEVLNDSVLVDQVKLLVHPIVDAVMDGFDERGGLQYEFNQKDHSFDAECHWWVQAEAVLGYFKAFLIWDDERYLNLSVKVWNFISNYIIDHDNGEWFWSSRNHMPNLDDDKVGLWKCPYHNGRMCMNMLDWISGMKK